MKFRTRTWLAALLSAVALAVTSAATASASETDDYARAVENSLIAQGATAAEVEAVLADPDLMAAVPISTEVVAQEWSTGDGPSVLQTRAIGSSCSGKQSYRSATRYYKNFYGHKLFHFKMTTRYCYNSSRVTYAYNVTSGNIYNLGAIGGWSYDGVVDGPSEGWGTYKGKNNGKVNSSATGKFTFSPIRLGQVGTGYIKIKTEVRYNGTSTWSTSYSGA